MDRDTNWEREDTEVAALFDGQGKVYKDMSPEIVVQDQYTAGLTDEFLLPSVLTDADGNAEIVHNNDAILFFNFRPDRARELSERIIEKSKTMHLLFATMTEYDASLNVPVLFPPEKISTTIADVVAGAGLKQAHIAETEKYAHVTYFLNGGNENEHELETFILIHSRKDVATHDKAPEMKVKEITDTAIQKLNEGYKFLAVNFANADMVGHTGIMEAAVQAIQAEDEQIGRLVHAVLEKNGIAVITADHGNAELMFDEKTGQPHTSHSLNPVPVIVTMKDISLRENGTMADIAPTVLKILGLPKPEAMTGESLY
jgi:2,3-bisphosphoglycerate-independent phosphoglycerate mutase